MAIDTATGKEAPAEISSERVKDIFSTIAKKYERFNAISSFGAYKMWLAGMIALVALDRFRQGKFYGLETDAQAHADLEQEY